MLYGTEELQSDPYDARLSTGSTLDNNDVVGITFGSPNISGQIIAISRYLAFDLEKSRPTMEAMVEQLEQKYGKALTREKDEYSSDLTLTWNFGGQCGDVSKNHNGIYSPNEFATYISEYDAGCDVVVEASVQEAPRTNDGKTRWVNISIVDIKRRSINARADFELFEEEVRKFNSAPVDAPKL